MSEPTEGEPQVNENWAPIEAAINEAMGIITDEDKPTAILVMVVRPPDYEKISWLTNMQPKGIRALIDQAYARFVAPAIRMRRELEGKGLPEDPSIAAGKIILPVNYKSGGKA